MTVDQKGKTSEKIVIKRKLKGEVVSAKMAKTIVVRVDSQKIHPVYKKRYKSSKKYKVHDPKEKYQAGDVIEIVSCRPMSKDKKWRVVYKS